MIDEFEGCVNPIWPHPVNLDKRPEKAYNFILDDIEKHRPSTAFKPNFLEEEMELVWNRLFWLVLTFVSGGLIWAIRLYQHPSDEKLAKYYDSKVVDREFKRIHRHVGFCWKCQSVVESCARGARAKN